jgi:predicted dehydrogenase
VSFDPAGLPQSWPRPAAPRPIVILGAGGIVQDAHMPAYRKAGFPVAGVFDRDPVRTAETAARWGIRAYRSLAEAAAERGAVFDVATPPGAHLEVLAALPDGAVALIQKPMGRTLDEATAILRLCRAKRLTAAVNFQLRFAPMVLPLRAAIAQGRLGRIVDVEVHLNLLTPWHLFPFLNGLERVEMAVHSIHYFDLIRAVMGNPVGVHARSLGHPRHRLAQTRTAALLDFAPGIRCVLSINHDHAFGRRFQSADIRFEGDTGAAQLKLGLLLDYPRGEPDELWITNGGAWLGVPLTGGWYPDAFVGRMANLQRFAAGEDAALESEVGDAWHTMALLEACFRSAAAPATPVPASP